MANCQSTSVNRLLVKEYEWAKIYTGTREELIEAGLAKVGDFPGDPGCRRKACNTFWRDQRKISIRVRSRARGMYTVDVGENDAEYEARCERDSTAKAAADVAAAATKALAQIPRNADIYRNRVSRTFERVMNRMVRPSLTGVRCKDADEEFFSAAAPLIYGDLGGYTLDAASLQEFDEAIEDAVAALRNATVRVNRVKQQSRLLELRGAVARADPAFGRFLTKSLAAAD